VHSGGVHSIVENPRCAAYLHHGWKDSIIGTHTPNSVGRGDVGLAIVCGGLRIAFQANVSVFAPKGAPAVSDKPIVVAVLFSRGFVRDHLRPVALHHHDVTKAAVVDAMIVTIAVTVDAPAAGDEDGPEVAISDGPAHAAAEGQQWVEQLIVNFGSDEETDQPCVSVY